MKKQYIQPGMNIHQLKVESVLAAVSPRYNLHNYNGYTPGQQGKAYETQGVLDQLYTDRTDILTGKLVNGDENEPD